MYHTPYNLCLRQIKQKDVSVKDTERVRDDLLCLLVKRYCSVTLIGDGQATRIRKVGSGIEKADVKKDK